MFTNKVRNSIRKGEEEKAFRKMSADIHHYKNLYPVRIVALIKRSVKIAIHIFNG